MGKNDRRKRQRILPSHQSYCYAHPPRMKAGPQVLPSLGRIQKLSLLTVDEIVWNNTPRKLNCGVSKCAQRKVVPQLSQNHIPSEDLPVRMAQQFPS